MMSNLSNRVQKSKSLKFNPVFHPHKIIYGTTSHNHEHHYQVTLAKTRETSPFGDKEISHDTITVICLQCHQPVSDCKGNSNSTICYHGLGAVRYHLAQKGATISFCQNIFDAIKLRKPGQSLVKIVSSQGQAVLWGVVGKREIKTLAEIEFEERMASMRLWAEGRVSIPKSTDKLAANVQAMRGSKEEAEGID